MEWWSPFWDCQFCSFEFDSTLFLNRFWKKWCPHAKKSKNLVNLEMGTCLQLLHCVNGDSLRMAANFHLVWEPYARAMTMGIQNSEQCPNFSTHRKSFSASNNCSGERRRAQNEMGGPVVWMWCLSGGIRWRWPARWSRCSNRRETKKQLSNVRRKRSNGGGGGEEKPESE